MGETVSEMYVSLDTVTLHAHSVENEDPPMQWSCTAEGVERGEACMLWDDASPVDCVAGAGVGVNVELTGATVGGAVRAPRTLPTGVEVFCGAMRWNMLMGLACTRRVRTAAPAMTVTAAVRNRRKDSSR